MAEAEQPEALVGVAGQRLGELLHRLVLAVVREGEGAEVDRQRGLRAQDPLGLHRLGRRLVHRPHEPLWLKGSDGEKRQS